MVQVRAAVAQLILVYIPVVQAADSVVVVVGLPPQVQQVQAPLV